MSHDEGQHCHCVADHRPAPLELAKHRIFPGEFGGTYTKANVVWLCPTTHVNVHEILDLLIGMNGLTEHEVRVLIDRPVSRYAYQIARQGYDQIAALP